MRNNEYKLLKKIASLVVRVRYPKTPEAYRYYLRDTIVCKLIQKKYFVADYIRKRAYKNIDYRGEFANELQFALPHAYWHYKNGTLHSTSSFPGTKDLYFFSENHSEKHTERTNDGNYNFDLPRILYSQDYNIGKWLPVPLKDQYRNDVYQYEKPILIIANKYNTEWDGPPVSFFSIKLLDIMISQLKHQYQIIYNRPQAKDIVNDNSIIYELGETEWLKAKHPEVLHMSDLYTANKIKANHFNHFQLCVYANCAHFISIHGGTATLASYFGGKNLIYSKQGPEHYFKCYAKLYPQFSGAEIQHAKTEDEVVACITKMF